MLEARHPVELVFRRRETRCQLSMNTWLQVMDLYTHLKTITEIFQITSLWFKEISYQDRWGLKQVRVLSLRKEKQKARPREAVSSENPC